MALYHLLRVVGGSLGLLLPGHVGQGPEEGRGEVNPDLQARDASDDLVLRKHLVRK